MKILEEYAIVKAQIKELEDKAKSMESEVRKILYDCEDHKTEEEYGTFYIVNKPKYEYTSLIKEIEVTLKESKKREEDNGFAKKTITEVLTFRPSKLGMPRGYYKFK